VPTTVRDALARGTAELTRAGCDSPRLDAELLLAAALDTDRAGLVTRARDPIPGDAAERFQTLLDRRRAREPVAYILGRRDFRRLTLHVDPRVLIPRPETELLVEAALDLPPAACVADVGTGSGAVALALKDERPDLRVTGLDVSPDALAVARLNGERLGIDVRWRAADLLDDGVYDAVLANLPYVADGARLEREITGFEPAGALFAGPDGLALIRRLLTQVAARPEVSTVMLEIGFDQADAVSAFMRDAGFSGVERCCDLAGHERVIAGRRRAPSSHGESEQVVK
jgi:release factor glutamine methyltransferase